jgi:DNA-binding transcriptional MerR regulator
MGHHVDELELLTTASFAKITDVVPDTVRLWERRGKITPACKTPSGINLYRRADAERIADERRARRAAAAPPEAK